MSDKETDKPIVTYTPGEFIMRYYHGLVIPSALLEEGELNVLLRQMYGVPEASQYNTCPYRVNVSGAGDEVYRIDEGSLVVHELTNIALHRIAEGSDKAEALKYAIDHIEETLRQPASLDSMQVYSIVDLVVNSIVWPTQAGNQTVH